MNKLLLFLILLTGLGACRSHPTQNIEYKLNLKDSLYWERRAIDTFINIPYSYVPLVILPDKMQPGDTQEKKEGQAKVKVEKRDDGSLLISASCDSLQIHFNLLQEKFSKVSEQNEQLKEQIKAAPNKWEWFGKGFLSALLFGFIVWIYKKVKK